TVPLPPSVPAFPSFLPPHAPPRALHPFPTRRSSDLRRLGRQVPREPRRDLAFDTDPDVAGRRQAHAAAMDPGGKHAAGTWVRDRTAEHTSELQSPCNLVCRLLLEKKKKNKKVKDTSR